MLGGKNEKGFLYTPLGTESYMAPEIAMRSPYSGTSCDIFSMGII